MSFDWSFSPAVRGWQDQPKAGVYREQKSVGMGNPSYCCCPCRHRSSSGGLRLKPKTVRAMFSRMTLC